MQTESAGNFMEMSYNYMTGFGGHTSSYTKLHKLRNRFSFAWRASSLQRRLVIARVCEVINTVLRGAKRSQNPCSGLVLLLCNEPYIRQKANEQLTADNEETTQQLERQRSHTRPLSWLSFMILYS